MYRQDDSKTTPRVAPAKEIFMALQITAQNFEQSVLKNTKPVLVDFWAAWCGPCRMVAPVIDELSNELTDIVVGKINVDEEPSLAEKFGIMSIPTLVLFENGKIKSKQVGAGSKQAILKFLGK